MIIQDQRPLPDYRVISSSGSVLVKSGTGRLIRVLLTSTQTFTMNIYDGLNANGQLIGTFSIAAADRAVTQWDFGVGLNTGLFIVTTGTPPLTIIFD